MVRSVRYFTFTQKMMSFSGLWYTQTHRERLLRYYIIGFMSLYCVVSELCQLLTLNMDLRSAVRLMQVFLPAVCATAVYSASAQHFVTIQKICNTVYRDWQRSMDDTELKIMQKHAYMYKLLTTVGTIILYVYVIMTVSPPLLRIIVSTNEVRADIDFYPIISCFDYFFHRETYYYPVIIYQTIATFVLVTASAACYSMNFSFILHACARLSIIKYKICCPFRNINQNNDIPVTPTDLSHWIIDIIRRLAKTTEFMTLVNSMFEKNYLFQMFLGLLVLILDFLCLFQIPVLLEHKEHRKDVLDLSLFIVGTFFTIYMNCYIGQKLMDYSTDVYREACLVPFHEISLKTQKLLLMTLTMCSKPYAVSIGKVYVTSHEFFSNLLRSALSFAMVVHSLQTI